MTAEDPSGQQDLTIILLKKLKTQNGEKQKRTRPMFIRPKERKLRHHWICFDMTGMNQKTNTYKKKIQIFRASACFTQQVSSKFIVCTCEHTC